MFQKEKREKKTHFVKVEGDAGTAVLGLDSLDILDGLQAGQRIFVHDVAGRKANLHDGHVALLAGKAGTDGQLHPVLVGVLEELRVQREERPLARNVHVVRRGHLKDGETAAHGRYLNLRRLGRQLF